MAINTAKTAKTGKNKSGKKFPRRPPQKVVVEENVVGFDAEKMMAPFILRTAALIIDYIAITLIPVIGFLIGRLLGYDGSKLINSEVLNVGWLFTILFMITNFLIFPIFAGQSIGKMFTGIRIAKDDGTIPTFSTILLRNLLGYTLTLLTMGMGYVLALFTGQGKALHDFLAGTVVVFAKHEVKSKVVTGKSKKNKGVKNKNRKGSIVKNGKVNRK